jgi:acyl-CoA hydrolase
MDFENPMHIGDLAQLTAKVTAVGKKSMEVQVLVSAENLATGTVTRTNTATLW